MELEEYINRVLDQLKWYERKALLARQRHVFLKLLNLILLAATPMVLMRSYLVLDSRIGVLIALCTSMAAFFISSFRDLQHYDSQWEQYRLAAEQLRKELTMFTMQAGEYGAIGEGKERRDLFIQRVESLVSRENSLWWVGEKKEPSHV
ncbi:MAG: DUF4231 domain-containing protein [Phycisphaerales bacterium]